ncbi:hypothetical protein [Aliikangiella coralliicola]|uniref:Uncharacterized protein n=1 Tax=Aliikangiella coralliicola TaxID=2592383 RepID=A0A545UD33_9GAMM|nr:hypothetical protein [Aliikangiella coralliicola]TQV87371.1 hypothetical protein FLL46_13060 [Aliikangiella coralliicola]
MIKPDFFSFLPDLSRFIEPLTINAIVAIFFYYLGIRTSKPKIVNSGSGRSSRTIGDKNVSQLHVTFRNLPSKFLLGGMRHDAKISNVYLFDREKGKAVGPVFWQQSGTTELSKETVIEVGRSATLVLFTTIKDKTNNSSNKEYFVHNLFDLNAEKTENCKTYTDEYKEFDIVIQFLNMELVKRFHIIVENEKNLSVRFKFTARDRWFLVKHALRDLVFALFHKS